MSRDLDKLFDVPTALGAEDDGWSDEEQWE